MNRKDGINWSNWYRLDVNRVLIHIQSIGKPILLLQSRRLVLVDHFQAGSNDVEVFYLAQAFSL
jgi:hypothetical protein